MAIAASAATSCALRELVQLRCAQIVILDRIPARLRASHPAGRIPRGEATRNSRRQLAQRAYLLLLGFTQRVGVFTWKQLPSNHPRRQFAAARAQAASQRRLAVQLRRHRAQHRVRHGVGRGIVLADPPLDFGRQVGRGGAAQCAGQVVARQRRQRAGHRLCRFLQVAAGAVVLHGIGVRPVHHVRIGVEPALLAQLCPRLGQRLRVRLRLQARDIALRADDVHRLAADLADQLHLPETVLLFLLVEDRADAAVVRVRRVTIQFRHVLALVGLVVHA
ncbi:Uncharacterised protein [Achromobacter xylosoxidans]|nr:Uncharacterised protein [Achromobacter xylosoxidans]